MSRWQKVRHNLLIWLAYVGLTIIVTWPLAGRLGTHIPGSEGDAWVHQWTFHWVRDQLLNGGDVFFTELMYHPQGVSLLQHNFAWFHISLWLPLQAVLGEGTAYTLIFLFGFSLTAYTTNRFAYELTKHETAAFGAGLVAGFWPYTLSHHNHPNLIFIGFIPLALIYTKRVWERPTWQNGLGLAIAVTLIGVVRWQLLALSLALLGGYWLYQGFLAWRQPGAVKAIVTTAVALVVAATLMFPLAWPLIRHQIEDQVTAEDLSANESRFGETDLLAYLTPSRYHPLWGEQAFSLTENFVVNKVFTPYLGVTVLIMAAFALRRRWQDSWIWLVLALVYMLFALGGTLTVNGRDILILPYRLLEDSFFAALVRRPDRFNVLLSIPMAMLTAYGFIEVGYLPKIFARKQLVWVFLCGFIIFESLTVYPTYELRTPAWYSELAKEEGDFAILELPRHPRVYDEQYMYYQFVHEKPLVGGHVSRPPAEMLNFINSVPMLRDGGLGLEPPMTVEDVGSQLDMLEKENVRYLILHKQFLSDTQQDAWKEWLIIEPVHEDRDLIVYDTAVRPAFTVELLPQIGIVEGSITPEEITQGGWAEINVTWASNGAVADDYDVCFSLRSPDYAMTSKRCRPVSAKVPTSQWSEKELMQAAYDLNVSPYLMAGGTYELEVSLLLEDEELEPVLLDTLEVAVQPRVFSASSPDVVKPIYWQSPIQLVGYDLDGDALTLHWHSIATISERYVIFRHVIDPDTGEIVAQVDSAPQNWGYPTSWWKAGEYVTDTVTLPLADLPPKAYEVRIGLYDEQTGERLAVFGPDGMVIPDAVVPLLVLDR